MVLSWGLLLPVGVLVARYGKGHKIWFNVHVACQILGITIASIGFLIAGTSLESGGSATHSTLGPIIMIMLWFQPLNAYFRPHAPNIEAGEQPSRKRVLWNYVHWYNGRLAVLLAVIQIFVGYSILQPPIGYVVLYDLVLVSLATVFVVLEYRRFRHDEKEQLVAHGELVEDSQIGSELPPPTDVALQTLSDAPPPHTSSDAAGASTDGTMQPISDPPPGGGSSDDVEPAQTAFDVAAV